MIRSVCRSFIHINGVDARDKLSYRSHNPVKAKSENDMPKNPEAVDAATAAVAAPSRILARLAGLACALIALVTFGACSILPAEHERGPNKEPGIRLVAREPNRLTFKFVVRSKPGATAGLTFWIGDKEHTFVSAAADRGTTVLEYTPDGLIWTTECPPEGVFAKPAYLRTGPISLNDFAFRPDPLVPDADGRLPIADGARPGEPKVTIYLSIADFEP